MRASTNIALKDRNTLTLEGFKGVDFSSSPHRVAANRAADAVNVIYEDGEIKKRKGWQQKQEAFSGRINGIFEYKNGTRKEQIIHVGTDIYVNNSKKSTSDMTVKDTRSSFFMNNGYCYIVCGDILVYGNFDGIYQLKRLVDMDVYIPTTTINIDAEGTEDTQIAVLESPNIFTPWRKNTLVGYDEGVELGKSITVTWRLDSNIEEESEVTIEAPGTILKNYTFSDTSKCDVYGNSVEKNSLYTGKNYLCEKKGGYIWGYFQYSPGTIRIIVDGEMGPYWGSSNGEANITVTFKAAGWEDKSAEITGCMFGTIFGTNGSSNRLFLSGNSSCPNRVFYSGYNDFTYFPDVNYINVGSETAKITGFCRLLDNTMAILKEKSLTDPTIYYMTGVQENEYDPSGKLADGRAVFYVEGGGIGEANINPYVTANLAGDALMLNENGVLGITLTQNMTTGARYVKERSYSVNDRLRLYDLSNAAGIVFENRYYLSVGGVCFVADARHKYYREGNDMDQSYNYEWWYWENVPARVWAIVDGKLWFGTADGKLCAFDTDGYEDITYFKGQDGDFTISADSDNDLKHITYIKDYSQETFEGKYIYIDGVDVYVGDSLKPHDEDWLDVEGDWISYIRKGDKIKSDAFGGSFGFIESTVTEIDYVGSRIKTDPTIVSEDGIDLVQSIKGIFPIINVNVEENFFQVKAPDGKAMRFVGVAKDLYDKVTIYDKPHVSAKWITPYFDMGSSMYGKTLLRLSVTAGEGSDTFLFGYETKRDSSMRPIHGTQSMDFNSFSFNAFSFNNKFASSHTVKTNVRNFNYIRFCFLSEDAVPFSVSKLEALYKINKMNRGVR